MMGIDTRAAKPDATSVQAGASTAADERRLNLLRQIALAGGTITPRVEPNAKHGYAYAALGDEVERDLAILSKRNYLEARFFDRVSLCPKCDSHHLNIREVCPSCRRAHLESQGLIHHFRCGYVGIPSEFLPSAEGTYRCPKCNCKMHHLGVQFDRLGKAFVCQGCGVISENPPVEAVCFSCGKQTSADDLVSTIVFSYVLTSRGAAAIRQGSFDSDEELVCIGGVTVYRRKVILEFFNHEMKRLRYFNIGFSVLLANCRASIMDQSGEDSSTSWLTRLRSFLREVDLIGQLTDSLYVVILPQTQQHEAEQLKQRIIAGLGPQSAFSLSAIEMNEHRSAEFLARNDQHDAPS